MIYWEMFYTFFTIGLFTIGGGYAMLPLIQERVVSNGWLEKQAIIEFIAVSESTPGPFAINIATYVGQVVGAEYGGVAGGVFGSVCATLGVVLPSFIIILLVAKFFEKFKNSRIVAGCMTGLRPVVIGLIGSAVLSMALQVFFGGGIALSAVTTFGFALSAAIFVLMTLLVFWKKVHPIVIILLSATLGIAGGYMELYLL